MDRLLCGDVGYGKTELAMRAAFKVVQDGRQVAVLAPTTVLAFQHFTTFRQRMAAFPVRVEMLSRFRTAAEQKKIVADAEAGRVDILIGTHRLLSKDVRLRDLGLLIVDEEQRFGVAAKEKLKKLKAGVDVLTMSATPIPRTLHMSLGGLRDLSVIETPPRGRLAIQTTVAPFNQALIQAAILQEMQRQGQVFFVHNRVESIFQMAALLQRLVPTGAHRRGARPDGRKRTGTGDAEVHAGRIRRAGGHVADRKWPGHPARQHHHRESRRPLRPCRPLPASRARGPLEPPRLRVFPDSVGRHPDAHRPAAAGGV